MKKFDALTPLGLLAGVVLVCYGIIVNGGIDNFLTFIDIASIIIVLGGVTAALLVSFPLKDIRHLFTVSKQAFITEKYDRNELIGTFVQLSMKARREGILSLEEELENLDDPFLRRGLLLVIDGIEPDVISDIMQAEISAMEERHRKGRHLLERAGEYSPAWGMTGTLIGLVLMLNNIDKPEQLGPSMAVAILTTLYGVVLANLVFIPLSVKLARKTDEEVFLKQLMIEGIIGVQSGENPRLLEEKLSAFLSEKERSARTSAKGAAEHEV